MVGLVYAAAFVPETGQSAFDLSTSAPGSTLGEALAAYPVATGGNEFAIRQEIFPHQFAADVPESDAALMAATQRPVTQAALSEPLATERPGWKDIPSWFVFGDADLNIPVAVHRAGAVRAGSQGTREIARASHAITVSQPEAVDRHHHRRRQGIRRRTDGIRRRVTGSGSFETGSSSELPLRRPANHPTGRRRR